eukprot:6081555-Pleurochrysis_carterae.AAC.1
MYCTSLGNSRVGSVASLRTQLTEDCQVAGRNQMRSREISCGRRVTARQRGLRRAFGRAPR